MLQTNAPMLIWGVVVLGVLTVCAFLIQASLKHAKDGVKASVDKFFAQLGMDALPLFVSIVLSILWSFIFLLLLAGLSGLIWDVLFEVPPTRDNAQGVWDWRFRLVQLTALTTVLGAVVILPVTLQRLRLTREQTDTSKETLLNQMISDAAQGLNARRERSRRVSSKKWENTWEDDVVHRSASIVRLKDLVSERPQTAERIGRLLSLCCREFSKQSKSYLPPTFSTSSYLKELRNWVNELEAFRSNLELAVQTLGELKEIPNVVSKDVKIDLSGANLQGFDLSVGNFENADFSDAIMHGANLQGSTLDGADFDGAKMQGADFAFTSLDKATFRETDLDGAIFIVTQLHGTLFENASLRGADFIDIQTDEFSRFDGVDPEGVDADVYARLSTVQSS